MSSDSKNHDLIRVSSPSHPYTPTPQIKIFGAERKKPTPVSRPHLPPFPLVRNLGDAIA
ncbi:hypothetical protein [Aulosira sp. FACHB-615]|uniref:hypothetical protein n=1 Tax=Aulosira sp. FACHB-615 TaxID=2692777 RepID=UPI00168285B0|nr:hypothetical protein [Aulosira sp. FACHB-615]MBD2490134.1 hypothetical protein [Aulosira sp. FACHB-615]